MSLFRRGAEKRFYVPSGTGDPWVIPTNGSLAAVTSAGLPVTEDTAMHLISVNSCVRILSDTVSGLPFDAVRAQGTVRKTVEPPPQIISDPFGGANDTRFASRREGFSQAMVSLLLRGNAYMLVVSRDKMLRPTRLRVLHPDRVQCAFNEDGERVYAVNREPISSMDIIHLMGMSYPEAPTGISVIAHARNAIGLGLAAEEFGSRFFGQGAHMSGVVEIDSDLDAERARQLKEAFTASHAGIQNSHTVGILSGGAHWKPISVTPEDAQFLGTRAAQDMNMATLFGIPPHMLGMTDRTTSWGTGIEQQALGFLQYTLSPWLGRFEDAFSAMLTKSQTAKFNVDGMLRTDAAGRYAVYGAARAAAIMTTNEIRGFENLAPIDGGDDIDAPLNSNVKPMQDTQAGKSQPSKDALGAVL